MAFVEQRVAVVNAGGWGTALAVKLANQGHQVRLWARREEQAARLQAERENRQYLPGVALPPSIRITSDLAMALDGVQTIVVAAIASYLPEICRLLKPLVPTDSALIHGTKGLDAASRRRPSEVVRDELGSDMSQDLAVLAGPNHAEEVARSLPAAAVIACANPERGTKLQELFNGPTFRVYTNPDVTGVELCSAAKNVIALAAGIGDGLGYGDNAKAALITRALAELGRLVQACGGSWSTVLGLAGVGDVVATCTSRHSRNRWAGEQIGRGRSVDEVTSSTSMVVEGIGSARAIVELAREAGVEMPICEGVCEVLFDGQSPHEALRALFAREVASELPGRARQRLEAEGQ
ncbi:MAG TPA: NAD(P)H-dependent glycerol-3-phosphate dehydrogenase [Chloroflexota bacterium]